MEGSVQFEVERSQELWRKTWKRDAEVGNIANEVVFENDRVRVWNLELPPGRRSPLHTHMNPYFSVIMKSSRLRAEFANGESSVDEDPEGAVLWYGLDDATRTHAIENIGDRLCVARVIELLA